MSVVPMSALGMLLLSCSCLVGRAAVGLPLISEVFYDAVGSDDGHSFVEISAAPGTELAGLSLEAINGDGGAVSARAELSGRVGGSGYFVLADRRSDGSSDVASFDLLGDFDPQNGPDGVRLLRGAEILDALGFGDFSMGRVFPGEGRPAPDAPSGSSLARRSILDTDDNFADFEITVPSPGRGPAFVPEPASALLLGGGLVAMALRQAGQSGRGRRPSHPSPRNDGHRSTRG